MPPQLFAQSGDACLVVAEPMYFLARKQTCVQVALADVDTKTRFQALASDVARLYKAILPDPTANDFSADYALIGIIRLMAGKP